MRFRHDPTRDREGGVPWSVPETPPPPPKEPPRPTSVPAAELEERYGGELHLYLHSSEAYHEVSQLPGVELSILGVRSNHPVSQATLRLGRVEITAACETCTHALHEAIAGDPEWFGMLRWAYYWTNRDGQRLESRHCRCRSTLSRPVDEPVRAAGGAR